jgi:hypothetical protein
MVEMDPKKWFSMRDFLEINPTKDLDNNKTQVAEWYVQAYSITHFLVRKHSRLQFKAFCAALRDGKSSAEALKSVYHFRTIGEFEKAWRAWLADPMHKRRVDALSAADRDTGDGVIEKASPRGASPFHAFSTGWEIKTQRVFPETSSGRPSGN